MNSYHPFGVSHPQKYPLDYCKLFHIISRNETNRALFLLLNDIAVNCLQSQAHHYAQMVLSEYEVTDFCDLASTKNETVYIRGVYSGIEEYWQISPIGGSCDSLQVNLQIPLEIESDPRWSEILDQVYEKYPTHCLIVDPIGKFETGSQDGYGHLGIKNSQFNVQRIINMQLINKKTYKEVFRP